MNEFKHFDLRLIEPTFNDGLIDIIMDLERLRATRRGKSRVDPHIFVQLKIIFHVLESLGSVRIEGNNTTISDVVDKTIDGSLKTSKEEKIKEFVNTQNALEFVENQVHAGTKIDRALISEIHKLVVKDLDSEKEGDISPGFYRTVQRAIKGSNHKLPAPALIQGYMDELIIFINDGEVPKYQLILTALAHHRFAWIHPFYNGNGRTVRLLTYAMLMSQGFSVNNILNPTAIFCNDRDKYYEMLAEADSGTNEALLKWARYVLSNLLEEIRKIDKLQDYDFLIPKILIPTIDHALKIKNINKEEYQILRIAIENQVVRPADVNLILKKKHASQVSLYISNLKKQGLLMEHPSKKFHYIISFTANHLLRGVTNALKEEGFIPNLD
jgi:Fic family protein